MKIDTKALGKLSEFNIVYLEDKMFIVTDKHKSNEALIFIDNGINNSDRVRSAYAKTYGVKFVDVRCSRLKNYKG